MSYLNEAEHFLNKETQFHLGFLPTEQSNPLSATLEDDFRKNTISGVKTLQRVDREVAAAAKNIFSSDNYARLVRDMTETLQNGGRIIFSGCGATGRLAILLESFWRARCRDFAGNCPEAEKYRNSVLSIMTGGDYALVKAVEFFEDYSSFGRRQCADLGVNRNDLLVAITEGGETSSVLGTLEEAVNRRAKAYLLFNNPARLLAEHLERSARAINNPGVTVLDLYCGPMALTGSTRMQATTMEQLIAGSALEETFRKAAGLPEIGTPAEDFEFLLDQLEKTESVRNIADMIDFENSTYTSGGRITYFCDRFMLDIFTDTTERTPTFMLPPFRACDDMNSPESWAFVKNPLYSTKECWKQQLNRDLRCLDWQKSDYLEMGASENILRRPPAISQSEILKFEIGNEPAPLRSRNKNDAAILVITPGEKLLENAFEKTAPAFPAVKYLRFGNGDEGEKTPGKSDWILSLSGIFAPRRGLYPTMLSHLAVKLFFNTVSTGTMVKSGRVSGNWMSYVALTNKKLIDRGIRLLAELGNLSYADACRIIFQTREELAQKGDRSTPAVRCALEKIRRGAAGKPGSAAEK